MLNDSMYGILFRDINPIRTFVDQRFSRQVHARAGIIINTGEDNYLTTADAVDAAHTVLGEAVTLLRQIGGQGLLTAIGEGTFGIMRRPADRGKGLDGVAKRDAGYWNPAIDLLDAQRHDAQRHDAEGQPG